MDPDTHGVSAVNAQPGGGYTLQGASFGATVEGNIISGAMLADDLGLDGGHGFHIRFETHDVTPYPNGPFMRADNVLRDNITYRVNTGLGLSGDALGATILRVENNVFVARRDGIDAQASNLDSASQIMVDDNRFYTDVMPPSAPWIGSRNTAVPLGEAAAMEAWPDPDRTLKRYVTEELGLTLLEWDDDPYLDPAAVKIRKDAGETYDPTGLKTFMSVATHMRRGGTASIPSAGKPDFKADYPWDERFTAAGVVNWVREGFGLSCIE